MEIIDDFAAVRLIINVYMIKKFKRSYKPVNQEIFIEDVLKEFRENNFLYTTKSILYTWKYLLDNYQYYKQNFTDDDARREWKYFELMDSCFETSKDSSEKFMNPKWTFLMLDSLSKYKTTVLNQGLTMKILQAVEDDFQTMENYDITQKDIYSHWLSLKKFYRQSLKFGCTKFNKKYVYYEAVKNFFENSTSQKYVVNQTVNTINESISQNELISAIESITPMEGATHGQIDVRNCNRVGAKLIYPTETSKVSNEKFSIAVLPRYTPFTIVMHDILLQRFKSCKTKIKSLNGEVDDATLNETFKEFQRLGYNVTKQSIRNEWNDLTYRYELIKNTEYPQTWPYFNDMDHIYSSEIMSECHNIDVTKESPIIDCLNGSNINNFSDLISDNVGQIALQTQKIAGNDAKMTESLLNVYESNSKEFVEIKDILIERNLLREETNYLLNAFVKKFNKSKR